MTDDDIHRWSAHRLRQAYLSGELSPVDLTRRCLEHAEAVAHLNAFCDTWADAALEAARRSAWRFRENRPLGPLDGLPVAIKDSFMLRGVPARCGSRTTRHEPALADGPTVSAMRRSGAVFLGRTTMPEFGWKAVCDSPLTGVTRNPYDPRLTPGGSSGGDAVAIASGTAALAIGADIGGSVRIPAAFCGIVAVKPTHNRAPRHAGSHASVLSREGPMSRSVADAALLLDIVEAADRADAGSRRDEDYYRSQVGESIGGMKAALLLDHPEIDGDPRVLNCVREAAQMFADLGGKLVEVDRSDLDLGGWRGTYERLLGAELAGELHGLDAEQRELLDPGLRRVVEEIERLPALDVAAANQARRRLLHKIASFMQNYDLLLTPTVPILPFEAERNVPRGWPHDAWTSWTPFTWPFNMSGSPAASIPCGLVDDLPVGLQLVAERSFDSHLIRAASALERGLALRMAPPVTAPSDLPARRTP